MKRLLLVLIGVVCVVGIGGGEKASERCKRQIIYFPTGECGSYTNCYDCLENPQCGWCGGAHCDTTAEGCFNKTWHDVAIPPEARPKPTGQKSAKHEEAKTICSGDADEWTGDVSQCSYCEQYPTCSHCLSVVVPTWRNKNATCGFCKLSTGDVGRCMRGSGEKPFYDECRGSWRTSYPRTIMAGECADYVSSCSSVSTCLYCVSSAFLRQGVSCGWCPHNNTCMEASSPHPCPDFIPHSTDALSVCPSSSPSSSSPSSSPSSSSSSSFSSPSPQSATTPHPQPTKGLHALFSLISSAIAIAICISLYIVYRLTL